MGYHCYDSVTKDHDFCLASRCSLLSFWLSCFDEENCHVGEAHVARNGAWPLDYSQQGTEIVSTTSHGGSAGNKHGAHLKADPSPVGASHETADPELTP